MGKYDCWIDTFSDVGFWVSFSIFFVIIFSFNRIIYMVMTFDKSKTRNDFAAYSSASLSAVISLIGCIGFLAKQYNIFRYSIIGIISYLISDLGTWAIPNRDFAIIIHHVVSSPLCLLWFKSPPNDILYLVVVAVLIEFTNLPCLHLSYYAKMYNWKRLYFFSGICKMTIYPILRIIGLPVMLYLFETDGTNIQWNSDHCIFMRYYFWIAYMFIVIFSIYFFAVMMMSPGKYLYLRKKESKQHVEMEQDDAGGEIMESMDI